MCGIARTECPNVLLLDKLRALRRFVAYLVEKLRLPGGWLLLKPSNSTGLPDDVVVCKFHLLEQVLELVVPGILRDDRLRLGCKSTHARRAVSNRQTLTIPPTTPVAAFR